MLVTAYLNAGCCNNHRKSCRSLYINHSSPPLPHNNFNLAKFPSIVNYIINLFHDRSLHFVMFLPVLCQSWPKPTAIPVTKKAADSWVF